MTAESGRSRWSAVLYGVVHPERGQWLIDNPVSHDGPHGSWSFSLVDSRFELCATGDRPSDFDTFRNDGLALVRGLVSALGFHLGATLKPELRGARIMDGLNVQEVEYGVAWAEAADRAPGSPIRVEGSDLGPLLEASRQAPLIRHALADLASAIDVPQDTAMYAYRAVESCRQLFVEPGDNGTAPSWARLRTAMGIARPDLDQLAEASVPRRHGELPAISGAERLVFIRLARRVIRCSVELLMAEKVTPG